MSLFELKPATSSNVAIDSATTLGFVASEPLSRRWLENDVRVWIVLRFALMDGSSWACRVRGTIVRDRRWCASNTCQRSK